MMHEYQIRDVEESDINRLVRLCEDHSEYEGDSYNPNGKSGDLGSFLFSENAPLKCLVVELQSELIGYATFMKQFSTWDASFYVYMDCLYLKYEARGMGIGKELMDEIGKYARSENCKVVQWQTPKSNVKAIKFYKNYGATSKEKERFFLNAEKKEVIQTREESKRK